MAKRIILFTFRDRFALLYYIIMIIVLGGFGCILFEKLDGEYIETGGTAQQDLNANLKEINNRVGSVVYLICFNYFLVMSNTSYKMVRENKIIYKELNAGLYRFPNYFFPKNVIDFAFLIVPVLILIYPVSGISDSLILSTGTFFTSEKTLGCSLCFLKYYCFLL